MSQKIFMNHFHLQTRTMSCPIIEQKNKVLVSIQPFEYPKPDPIESDNLKNESSESSDTEIISDNDSDIEESSENEKSIEIGTCCFCGQECNYCSQACGRCVRKMDFLHHY